MRTPRGGCFHRVEDDGWFFDTELLLLAERNGLRIHEVPVDWVDDADSRVDVVRTACDDLRGTARMVRTFATGRGTLELGPVARPRLADDFGRRLVSFTAIGAAGTVVSLVLLRMVRRGRFRALPCPTRPHPDPSSHRPRTELIMASTTLIPPAAPVPTPPDGAAVAPGRSRLHRLWRGPEADPVWARPALFVLLAVTAVLYLWGLGASGWANSYYSAAVQAATKSWKAFFFGSTDSSNFITIDKTPASMWPMAISARIFGLSSWSILVPQALAGVGVVGVLHATVKRWFSPGAALLAGAVAALTPVAALMFRFNNPDALLVLLLTGSAYAMTRALEAGKTRWLVLAGVLVGFAFLTKELQAFLVLPGFGLVYLLAGPPRFGRRVRAARRPRGHDAGRGGMVGGDRPADPGLGPAVHRRIAEQQLLERLVRVQRLRPAHG